MSYNKMGMSDIGMSHIKKFMRTPSLLAHTIP